jgi:hypothetical protein
MPYEISNNPPPSNSQQVYASDNNNDKVEIIKDSSGKTEVTDTNKNASLSIEDHELLVVSHTSLAKADVSEFAEGLKQSFSAKVKDFFHIGSASGEVKEKAKALARSLDHLSDMVPALAANDLGGLQEIGTAKYALHDVMQDATQYAAALNKWLSKHDANPGGPPSGSDQDRIKNMRSQLKEVNTLLDTISGKIDDKVVAASLLQKLPTDFPVNGAPKLKSLLLYGTAYSLATYKGDESMYMRGNEYRLFNTETSKLLDKHYSGPIGKLTKDSDLKAKKEFAVHGGNLPPPEKFSNKDLLSIDEVRAEVAKDYQTFITGLLGPDKQSARQAAHALPPDMLKSLQTIKRALDEQVADGKISQEKADKRLSMILNNAFALRTLNTSILKNPEQAPGMEGTYINMRRVALTVLLQTQINGVPFGHNAPAQVELNDILAPEKAKLDAFMTELKQML